MIPSFRAGAPTAHGIEAGPAWCGTDETSVDRKPDEDAWSPHQIHVLYAFPADEDDRFGEFAATITSDVAAIDAWWRQQDPVRAPRWDRFAFPGCETRAGSLDLLSVRLPRGAEAYVDSNRMDALVEDLLTVIGPLEKSVVYYDGPRSEPGICGTSEIAPLYAGRLGFSFVWTRSTCGGGVAAATAAHELVHSLGAVQREGPPNRCRDGARTGHVCDDVQDLMFPYSSGHPLADLILDAHRDDYYGHPGTWWDVRDSAWLTHLPQGRMRVTVLNRGGSGSVRSDVPGIDCGTSCTALWDDGLRVTLTASAVEGSRLWSWNGACSGWSPTCRVSVDGTDEIGATFGANRYRVSVRIRGNGTVTSSPSRLSCRSQCGAWFAPGIRVRLQPHASRGWRFSAWTGACGGARTCAITTNRDRTTTATFVRR